ncbi:hypothetical protein ACFE04_014937 [Oxalis oulophora]
MEFATMLSSAIRRMEIVGNKIDHLTRLGVKGTELARLVRRLWLIAPRLHTQKRGDDGLSVLYDRFQVDHSFYELHPPHGKMDSTEVALGKEGTFTVKQLESMLRMRAKVQVMEGDNASAKRKIWAVEQEVAVEEEVIEPQPEGMGPANVEHKRVVHKPSKSKDVDLSEEDEVSTSVEEATKESLLSVILALAIHGPQIYLNVTCLWTRPYFATCQLFNQFVHEGGARTSDPSTSGDTEGVDHDSFPSVSTERDDEYSSSGDANKEVRRKAEFVSPPSPLFVPVETEDVPTPLQVILHSSSIPEVFILDEEVNEGMTTKEGGERASADSSLRRNQIVELIFVDVVRIMLASDSPSPGDAKDVVRSSVEGDDELAMGLVHVSLDAFLSIDGLTPTATRPFFSARSFFTFGPFSRFELVGQALFHS